MFIFEIQECNYKRREYGNKYDKHLNNVNNEDNYKNYV